MNWRGRLLQKSDLTSCQILWVGPVGNVGDIQSRLPEESRFV